MNYRVKIAAAIAVMIILLAAGCDLLTEKEDEQHLFTWLGSLDAHPENPQLYWAYYNTADGSSYIFNGMIWNLLAAGSTDGISIVWKGSSSTAPENPQEYWAYHNTETGNSYIFNGNYWELLAASGADGDSSNGTVIQETYYTLLYDGNGHTSGSIPAHSSTYLVNRTVTVLDNTGDLEKRGFTFGGWNSKEDGSGFTYQPGDTFTMPALNFVLYAQWDWMLGGTGQAGGTIFYIDEDNAFEWTYLEAAPVSTEWQSKPWGGYGEEAGTEKEIGTGAANTAAIVAAYGDEEPYESRYDYAARLCSELVVEYKGTAYNDWFLPSRDELHEMYKNLHDQVSPKGDFSPEAYWSSSEQKLNVTNAAWARFFDSGVGVTAVKYNEFRVRAVRAF